MPTAIDVMILAVDGVDPTVTQVHGLACSLLEGPGTEHEAQDKPWTAWPLREVARTSARGGGASSALRLNWLDDRARPALLESLPERVRLGSRWYPVLAADVRVIPYASLVRGAPSRVAELDFLRPTYFSRNGRDLPLPDPVLILRSLVQRWNMWAPAELLIDAPAAEGLTSAVVLLGMQGGTETVTEKGRSTRRGFVGSARIGLPSDVDPALFPQFAALMRGAEYIGVGAGTTRGFGVVTGVPLMGTGSAEVRPRS